MGMVGPIQHVPHLLKITIEVFLYSFNNNNLVHPSPRNSHTKNSILLKNKTGPITNVIPVNTVSDRVIQVTISQCMVGKLIKRLIKKDHETATLV